MLFYIILLVTVNSVLLQQAKKYEVTLHFQLRNLAYSQKKLSTTFLTNYVG